MDLPEAQDAPTARSETDMKKIVLAATAACALAGCGTQTGDRLASGAAIGAGAGAVFGGVGALPGAVVGAAVGGLTTPDQVNLGDPPWKDE
jgi:branched-subunit amino acid ABC-type transport system permease component